MIKDRQGVGWQFVFLAANQDAIAAGGQLGIAKGDSLTFAYTGQGVQAACFATSGKVAEYRTSGLNTAFSDTDRSKAT